MFAAYWRLADLHKGGDGVTALNAHPTLFILSTHQRESISAS
jgi:hypothetical protein